MSKSIIRAEKNRDNPYVMIARLVFEDERLSWKAKGIIGYLLSRPDNWQVNVADLQGRSTDGRDSCYAGLKELADHGYIEKRQLRENGKLAGYEYVVFETPRTAENQSNSPAVSGKPVNGNAVSGKSPTNNKEYKIINENNKRPSADDRGDSFNSFWAIYPRKVKKEAALKAWNKIAKSEFNPEAIIAALQNQIRAVYANRAMDKIPHASTWLNGKQWNDEVAGQANTQPAQTAKTIQTYEPDYYKPVQLPEIRLESTPEQAAAAREAYQQLMQVMGRA